MLSLRKALMGITGAGLLAVLCLWAFQGAVAQTPSNHPSKRVDIELSEDFYKALNTENSKSYTTNKSDEYLRQIAISTRFMVESNLQILNRQEQIIALLEKSGPRPEKKP
jgi:hypothetical protein